MKKLLFQILPLFAVALVACNDTTEVIPVSEVKVTPTTLTINAGESYQLKAQVLPAEAYYDGIEWKSSNANVASVDNNGRINAISGGKATISAKAGGVSASCSVTVNVLASSIQLSESNISFTTIGATAQLTATVEPNNTSDKTITWKSSNDKVATVSNDGLITSIDNGNAKITASCGDVSASCEVNVAVAASAITLSQTELSLNKIGATVQLTATIEPNNAADKTIEWSSSDNNIVTVSNDGLVTAVAIGEATITATCGDVSATCAVSIKDSIITVDGNTGTLNITGANTETIKNAIKEATDAGATTLAVKGDYSALQLSTTSNVFIGANISVLDLSGVTNWPTNTGNKPMIPDQAFRENGSDFVNIKEIILPSDIYQIGSYAFYKCSNLKKVTAQGVEVIGDYGFSTCTSLSEIDMPEVTTIGVSSFFRAGLTKITFNKVTALNNAASFWMCTKLTEVNLPECTSIGSVGSKKTGALADCSALTTVNMPKLKIIGDHAFDCCSALSSVEFPLATDIGSSAFYKCKALKSIIIPKVTTIYDYAFNTCPAMESIVLTSPEDITIKSSSNSFGAYSNDTKDVTLTLNSNKQDEVNSDNPDTPKWKGFTWKAILFTE